MSRDNPEAMVIGDGVPLKSLAETTVPADYQVGLDRIGEIFSSIMTTVEDVTMRRCPYRNRLDLCTAQFGCRNQRKQNDRTQPKTCGGDDKLDHRSAWDTGQTAA
jgi:hypothetical protein